MNKIIETNNLSYWVKQKVNIFRWKKKYLLSNVNFNIKKGECVSIFGRNGAGKTTLLEVLFGFRERYEGEIKYANHFPELKLGYVLQKTAFGYSNIHSLIKLHLKLFEKNKQDLDQLLNKLDFKEILHIKFTYQLSRGQKQKLKLLLMVLKDPNFLVIDEITTSLDYKSRKTIIDFLINLKREKQITIFMISHNVREIAKLADHFYHINNQTLEEKIELPKLFQDKLNFLTKYLKGELNDQENIVDQLY